VIAPLPGSLRAEHRRTSPLAGVNWPSGAGERTGWGDRLAAGALLALWATLVAMIGLAWFAPEGCPVDAAVFGDEHACDAYVRDAAYWDARTPNTNTEAAP
jgi:hypothetical protein